MQHRAEWHHEWSKLSRWRTERWPSRKQICLQVGNKLIRFDSIKMTANQCEPVDLIPLQMQKKHTTQTRNKQSTSHHWNPPGLSIPSVIWKLGIYKIRFSISQLKHQLTCKISFSQNSTTESTERFVLGIPCSQQFSVFHLLPHWDQGSTSWNE